MYNLYMLEHRVSNDSQRTWLLPHSSPPCLHSRQQVVYLSQSSYVSPVGITEGKGVGEEPNHSTARKPGPL
jgi:hypothetical protein